MLVAWYLALKRYNLILMTNLPPFTEYSAKLRAKLSKLLPDFEIEAKAELAYQIEEVKREKNAIILGHNYMEPAL